jgi:hypothetical protein
MSFLAAATLDVSTFTLPVLFETFPTAFESLFATSSTVPKAFFAASILDVSIGLADTFCIVSKVLIRVFNAFDIDRSAGDIPSYKFIAVLIVAN